MNKYLKNLKKCLVVSFFPLTLILFISVNLVYQHQASLRDRSRELQELREQVQRQYNLQQSQLISIGGLVDNPEVHGFFTDLLRNNAEKFAKSKKLDISRLPLKFAGFHAGPNPSKAHGRMGMCWKEREVVKISLNRLYLLNKFGHDKYFTSSPREESDDYTFSFIDFVGMIHTCSHELAHYLQLVQHGKSSCESDLMLKTGKYDKELASEHENSTGEICQLINHSELKKKWNCIR